MKHKYPLPYSLLLLLTRETERDTFIVFHVEYFEVRGGAVADGGIAIWRLHAMRHGSTFQQIEQ